MFSGEALVNVIVPLETHKTDSSGKLLPSHLHLRKVADGSSSDSQIEIGNMRTVIIGHNKDQWAKLRDMCAEIVDQYESLEQGKADNV